MVFDNVVDLTTVRKIKGLEKSIFVKKQILRIKEDYLNRLSQFQQYDSIRIECHKLNDVIMKMTFSIGMYEQTLERLRKEV